MNKKVLVGLLVLLAGVALGWYALGGKKTGTTVKEETLVSTPSPQPAAEKTEEATGATMKKDEALMEKAAVELTDSGFSPKTLTVKKGTTVTFKNTSSGGMWVASAVHPTHQLLPDLNQLKSVNKGGAYEYTFEKVGTWKYHNHVSPADTGSVVVTE